MWNWEFVKATIERMIRGAAVAVGAVYFSGELVFDSFNVAGWADVGQLAVGGAFGSLILSLIGNTVSGNGPALTQTERVGPT